jgi:DNA repair photolyase
MFGMVTETWNPITGCLHNCVYCWARRLALTRLRNTRRYRDGFKPRLNEEEFRRRFNGGVVFVSDMGDMWGEWVPDEWIRRVLNHIRRFPNTRFLFLTKNCCRTH